MGLLKEARKLKLAYVTIGLITFVFLYVAKLTPGEAMADCFGAYILGVVGIAGGYAGANVWEKISVRGNELSQKPQDGNADNQPLPYP
jgi:hypothetical protein